ncbi:MAG TPA: NADPH:quinone reductase [Burkholderiales bacterium]|nr:NADPH:quinone reductase [Burkholderiales bacterium]
MKAAFFRRTGAAREVFEVGELPAPAPGPGEVRVRIHASGVNPSDTYTRSGRTKRPWSYPLIVPHSDGAGVIEEVGEGVPASRIGERVWIHNGQWLRQFGTAAEHLCIAAELANRLPDGVSFAEGACLGIPALTAYFAVTLEGSVQGQKILVQGGAGAVGHYAVQIAKLKGAHVIATVSSDAKAAHARAAGADQVINYRAGKVEASVDRVLEVNLSANAALDAAVLKPNGSVVVYGSDDDVAPVLARASIVKAIAYRFFLVYEMPLAKRQAAIAELTRWMEEGRLRHTVAQRFALADIAAAHEAVEGRQAMGNVVLDVR